MSLPEQLDCNPQIAVQGLVGYEFGRQCVELGRLTSRIMEHAFMDISAPEDLALLAPKFYGFTDGLDLEHPSIQPVLAKYSRRYRDLSLAYIEYPSDNEFSQAVFQVKPAKQVAASRFAGGVIFSLAKEDYINSFRNMSSNPDKAEKKAIRSAGMAFAELVTIDENGTDIPVGMIKANNTNLEQSGSTITHELQHLLHSLYIPKRRQANIRKRKPEIKQPRYQTEKKLVAGIANTMLKGVIDQSIRNEFLAQIAGGRSINYAVDVLAEEVEERGVCYDYVTENRDAILKAATTNINDFPDVDSIAAAAENKIRETYHQYLDRVAKKVIQYGLQSSHFAPLNEKQLISLLAPHPFHLWPVVLRAVNAYARGLEDRSTLSTLLRN